MSARVVALVVPYTKEPQAPTPHTAHSAAWALEVRVLNHPRHRLRHKKLCAMSRPRISLGACTAGARASPTFLRGIAIRGMVAPSRRTRC